MKNFCILPLLLVIFISSTTISCMTPAKYARKRMNTNVIPADFDPNKHVLLLAEMPKRNDPNARHEGVTRKLDNAFKKHYSYKYEIASTKEIMDKNGRFKDTSVYKFALLNSLSSYSHSTTTTVTNRNSTGTSHYSVSPTATSTMIDFRFFNRANGHVYPQTGEPHAHLSGFAHAYADFIELAQKKKNK